MKRQVVCIVMLIALFLSGCNTHGYGTMESGKINIVCTTFPLYDWTRNLVGEENPNVNVVLLIANGEDSHSYQATARDIAMLNSCDVLFYVGGESDRWIYDAIVQNQSNQQKRIRLMDYLNDSILEEEIAEGMQNEEEHDHADDGDEIEYDEHVWLSVKNANHMCYEIMKVLQEVDPGQKSSYQANLEFYQEKLMKLDEQMQEVAQNASINTVVFGDRFPFRYWMSDYDLNYFAAFPGCSAETEASFETITFLAGKMDETKNHYIVILENSSDKVARTIIESTVEKNQEIAVLNSMQSVTGKQIDTGASYLDIMEQNIETLEMVLTSINE